MKSSQLRSAVSGVARFGCPATVARGRGVATLAAADGTRLGQNSLAFLELLTKEVPNEDTRMELLRFFSEQQTKTAQTKDLAQGKATLFLTPQDLNLKLQMPPPGASAL